MLTMWISARRPGGWVLTAVLILGSQAGCGGDHRGNGEDAAVDAACQDAAVDADPGRYEPIQLRFQMQMLENDVPGAAFAILEGGEVVHAMGYGRKHPDQPEPVEPRTLFRIASVTKMMTAVGLLQQVQDGTIAREDLLVDHLPGFVFTSDATDTSEITVEHLLTHSSGIVDYLTVDATAAYRDATALQDYTYEVFADLGHVMAPPGRMFNYTNPGFIFAGLLIEQASGEFYGSYLRDHVLLPLGMERTWFAPSDVLADGDYATGELKGDTWAAMFPSRRVGPDAYDNPWGWPAGFAFSSVLDLGEFVRFLRDGEPTVLAEELWADMQSPRVNTHWTADIGFYGYGLILQQGFFVGADFYDLELISHNGALPGFSSEIVYVPGCDLGFVTLANTDGAYFRDSLEVAVESLCDLPVPVTAPGLAADPADHPDFVGTYHEPQYFGDLIITQDGTELRVEIPALSPTAYDPVLLPVSKDVYLVFAGYYYDLTFIRDAGGQAEYLRNRGFVARRVPAGAPPSPPPRSPDPRSDLARRLRHAPPQYAPLALPRSQRHRLRRLLRETR